MLQLSTGTLLSTLFLSTFLLSNSYSATWSGPYDSAQKDKTVKILMSYVSSWITAPVWTSIINKVEPAVYSNNNCSAVGMAAISAIIASLTGPQYLAAMQCYSTIALKVNIVSVVAVLKDVMWNNACPFYAQVINKVESSIYSNNNCSAVGLAAISAALSSLTGPQYLAAMGAYSQIGLKINVLDAVVILKNVIWNNCCPFYAQIQEWNTNNIWNHTQAGVDANWFRFINEFLTFKRTGTIFTLLKEALDQAGYWSAIRSSDIGTWLLFSQYGL